MCAALLSGGWWVFPMIGFVICAGLMLVAFRFNRTGRGCACMGGARNTTYNVAQPVPGVDPSSR